MTNRTLNEIMNDHGSDKGDGNWPNHHYAWLYDQWMTSRRMEAVNLLEIGMTRDVKGRKFPCASVKGWLEYFPHAAIVGYDLDEWKMDNPRVSFFRGDQGDPVDLERFRSAYQGVHFDYVIDDGSHKTKDQVTSFVELFPMVRPGGLYIIEDCSMDTVEAFDSLRLHGVMLPSVGCSLTTEECDLVSDLSGACLHTYIPGCHRRANKSNHLMVIHRKPQ